MVITDPELMNKLNEAKGKPMFELIRERLERKQAELNRRKKMTPIERRRDLVREEVRNNPLQHIDRHHIHSVLALCSFPYKKPFEATRFFTKEYGKNSLTVSAGILKDPKTGKMVEQGLPYGPKARLLMLHICTQALRQKSAEVEIGDSLTGLIRDLGYQATGGANGTINLFKEQLQRLAAARIAIGLWDEKSQRSKTIKTDTIQALDLWLDGDPNQERLWSSTVTLSNDFYQSLLKHAMPVDIRAVSSFTHSAKQIDIFLWLAYRLRNLDSPYMLSWSVIREQFGAEVKVERRFKKSFKDDLSAIQEVFPHLKLTLNDQGLKLYPTDPEKFLISPKKGITSISQPNKKLFSV